MAANSAAHQKAGPATDLTQWRLTCKNGRQTWDYDGSARGSTLFELHNLGLETVGCTGGEGCGL